VIVLDASAAVEWLLGRPAAPEVAAHLADPDTIINAPSTLGVEVASAMRGLVRGGYADPERGRQAISDLSDADIVLHDPSPLLQRAWQVRDNLSIYDGVYVALAEVLDATLVTGDARVARAPGVTAAVDVIAVR